MISVAVVLLTRFMGNDCGMRVLILAISYFSLLVIYQYFPGHYFASRYRSNQIKTGATKADETTDLPGHFDIFSTSWIACSFTVAKCGFNWLVEQGESYQPEPRLYESNQQIVTVFHACVLLCIFVSFSLPFALALHKPMKISCSSYEATRYFKCRNTKRRTEWQKNVTVFSAALDITVITFIGTS